MQPPARPSNNRPVDRKPESGDRLSLVVQVAAILFACAAFSGLYLLRGGGATFPGIWIVMGPPASAALLFVGSTLLFPNLLAPGRIAFPLNITLPVVYALLTRVSVVLWVSPTSAAFAPFDPMMPALMWSRTDALAVVALLQCAVLSTLVVAKNR